MNPEDIKNLEKDIQRVIDSHHIAALIHITPFAEMLKDNPNKAIDMIFQKYNEALDEAYTGDKGKNNRAFVEAIAGGPYEAVPWALYNAVGTVYPYLERPLRDKALKQILSILDKRNYAEVNGSRGVGHTTGIREPLLLSDITIVRGLYWPGLHDEECLWKDCNNFFDLQKEIIDDEGYFRRDKVRSDFLVAYALLRSDFTQFGEDYVKAANPFFLERVLKGIVGLRFARAETEEKIYSGRDRLKELLPKSTHDRIESLRQEADWVDYKKFL